jgi:DNA invertase Pin-like site-specific DNA recombinase
LEKMHRMAIARTRFMPLKRGARRSALLARQVDLRSYTQPFLDTGNEMTNGIVLSVLSAVAQQERITLSERTKAGLQRAKRAGRALGRRAVKG